VQTITLAKINNALAIFIVLAFLLEFVILATTDFSHNPGTTKLTALFYFAIGYFGSTLPAIFSLILRKWLAKNKPALIIAIILNVISFASSIPMLIEYLKPLTSR
jgi:hypothetical protein